MINIDHVAINVIDLQESVNWYIENFKASIIYQDETWAMLKIGQSKLALTIPTQHPPHIAITVNNINDFPEGKIKRHRDGSQYLYVKDPAGNIVEYIYYEPISMKSEEWSFT